MLPIIYIHTIINYKDWMFWLHKLRFFVRIQGITLLTSQILLGYSPKNAYTLKNKYRIKSKQAVSSPWQSANDRCLAFNVWLPKRRNLHHYTSSHILCLYYPRRGENLPSSCSNFISKWAQFRFSNIQNVLKKYSQLRIATLWFVIWKFWMFAHP